MSKPRCSVCNHSNRMEIEEHLIKGTLSIRKIAEAYDLSASAVGRHRKKCLTREVAETFIHDEVEGVEDFDRAPTRFMTGDDVLYELHDLITNAKTIFKEERANEESSNLIALKALESINKFIQTYVGFMELGQQKQGEAELKDWRVIAGYIWEFVEEKGLRGEFEAGLRKRGIG